MHPTQRTAQSPEHAVAQLRDHAGKRDRSPSDEARRDEGIVVEVRTGDVLPDGGPPTQGTR